MFAIKEDQGPEKERTQYPLAVTLSGQPFCFDLKGTKIIIKLSDDIYMRKTNHTHE